MRSGMRCPINRGGCGKVLEWDEGAFCKECMTKALYRKLVSEKEAAERFPEKRFRAVKNDSPRGKVA